MEQQLRQPEPHKAKRWPSPCQSPVQPTSQPIYPSSIRARVYYSRCYAIQFVGAEGEGCSIACADDQDRSHLRARRRLRPAQSGGWT